MTTFGAAPGRRPHDFFRFDQRARNGDRMVIAFLGGSLTWGSQATNPQVTSYRALLGRKFEEAYPDAHFRCWDASIGGTGSQLAAFRLERDVLAHQPDLLFLDFTINDDPYSPPDPSRLASYESLVRRLIQAGIPIVQVILPAKKDMEANPPERPLDARHQEIASSYGVPVADAVAWVKREVTGGKITPDQIWDMPPDGTHPGDAGYALYAEASWEAYEDAVGRKMECRLPERMLHADTYMTVNRHRLTATPVLPGGWKEGKPHRNAIAFDFICSRWMDDLLIAGPEALPLRLTIPAVDVMLFGEQTKQSGNYAVRIDGGEPKTYSAHYPWGDLRLVEMVAQGLDPARTHDIEIIPALKEGEELRLESICAAGGLIP